MSTVDLRNGDCLDILKTLPDNSVDAVVTDPPYGLSNTNPSQVADALTAWVTGDDTAVPAKRGGFMGKDWDSFVPPPAVWAECLRVLKPGGHMAVFAGARTQDLMGLSIRLAGFEIRDTLGWIYGCLSEDTEVLINGKWTQYRNAKVGDHALCYNREYDTYEWQAIEDTHEYEYSDTAYRIHSDNTDQIVSRNHRVLVERGGTYEFEFAENLAQEHEIRVPVLENVRALLNDLSVREPQPGAAESVLQPELQHVGASPQRGEAYGSARNDGNSVRRVRDEGVQAKRLVEANKNADVFEQVQREAARSGVEVARAQGARGVVRGNESAVRGEPARREQPGLEGRRHPEKGTRELQGCPVCEVPTRVPEYVTEGRVRDGAPASGGSGYRATPVADGSCTSCESQAGGQSLGEPVSVRVEPGSQAVRGARHTVADLAAIEPVHYDGVVWCLTVPTGAFVVRRKGKVFVTGNSGFPKSLDVSKAIDKQKHDKGDMLRFCSWLRERCTDLEVSKRDLDTAAGTSDMGGWWTSNLPHRCAIPTEEQWGKIENLVGALPEWAAPLITPSRQPNKNWGKREVTQEAKRDLVQGEHITFDQRSSKERERRDIPASDAARRWDGWGTALKPAIEPIILARKPLDGTVAANVLAHGVGGLNIDACRVGTTVETWPKSRMYGGNPSEVAFTKTSGEAVSAQPTGEAPAGRFPANVLLDEHAAKEMDEQSGVLKTGGVIRNSGSREVYGTNYESDAPRSFDANSGGASRFFPVFKYQAKAPKRERPVIVREDGTKIAHPTVKPLALLDWLVTLITPEGGTTLDPFAGTGTTLQAARDEGFNVIGIEQDPEYIELIRHRLDSNPAPEAPDDDPVLF